MPSKLELLREQYRLIRRLREIEQELCPHDGETFERLEWTWHGKACSKCHKVLEHVNHATVVTGSDG
jgi:hypothetical protein